MSGGSWNYAFRKLEEISCDLIACRQIERKAFGRLIEKCANVLKTIEWADSADMSQEDARVAIKELLTTQQILEVAIEQAQATSKELRELIDEATNSVATGRKSVGKV